MATKNRLLIITVSGNAQGGTGRDELTWVDNDGICVYIPMYEEWEDGDQNKITSRYEGNYTIYDRNNYQKLSRYDLSVDEFKKRYPDCTNNLVKNDECDNVKTGVNNKVDNNILQCTTFYEDGSNENMYIFPHEPTLIPYSGTANIIRYSTYGDASGSFTTNGSKKTNVIEDVDGNMNTLKEVTVSGKLTDLTNFLHDTNDSIRTIDCGGMDVSEVEKFDDCFYSYQYGVVPEKLTKINVKNWNTAKAKSFTQCFRGLEGIKTLDLSNWHFAYTEYGGESSGDITHCERMFQGCSNLISLDLSSFYILTSWREIGSYKPYFDDIFDGCDSLTYIRCTQAFKERLEEYDELPPLAKEENSGFVWDLVSRPINPFSGSDEDDNKFKLGYQEGKPPYEAPNQGWDKIYGKINHVGEYPPNIGDLLVHVKKEEGDDGWYCFVTLLKNGEPGGQWIDHSYNVRDRGIYRNTILGIVVSGDSDVGEMYWDPFDDGNSRPGFLVMSLYDMSTATPKKGCFSEFGPTMNFGGGDSGNHYTTINTHGTLNKALVSGQSVTVTKDNANIFKFAIDKNNVESYECYGNGNKGTEWEEIGVYTDYKITDKSYALPSPYLYVEEPDYAPQLPFNEEYYSNDDALSFFNSKERTDYLYENHLKNGSNAIKCCKEYRTLINRGVTIESFSSEILGYYDCFFDIWHLPSLSELGLMYFAKRKINETIEKLHSYKIPASYIDNDYISCTEFDASNCYVLNKQGIAEVRSKTNTKANARAFALCKDYDEFFEDLENKQLYGDE